MEKMVQQLSTLEQQLKQRDTEKQALAAQIAAGNADSDKQSAQLKKNSLPWLRIKLRWKNRLHS